MTYKCFSFPRFVSVLFETFFQFLLDILHCFP
jgi:hypothetical protein